MQKNILNRLSGYVMNIEYPSKGNNTAGKSDPTFEMYTKMTKIRIKYKRM